MVRVMDSVHIIGIGGIGTSSLAQYFLSEGYVVTGSDAVRSEITDDLKKKGVRIFIGHKKTNLGHPALVIYSAAILPTNLERQAAVKRNIPTRSYAEALGELTKQYTTFAVSGSHGKSTTTALISLVLIKAGFDPTVIIGTKIREFSGNFRKGDSRYLVIESDEYNRSFHSYFPKVIILTNVDKEHLDTYKNYRGVIKGFVHYVKHLPSDGILIANWSDAGARAVAKESGARTVWYNKGKFARHNLSIPGRHNQENAEAVWQAAQTLGIKRGLVEGVLHLYKGAWRRLEKLKTKSFPPNADQPRAERLKANLYTDYAHHPTEIKATLQALRERHPDKKLLCVFQPHQIDRFNRLFSDFKNAFAQADKVVLLPVYVVRGRESVAGRTPKDLVRTARKKNLFYAETLKEALCILETDLKNVTLVFMSAGDLDSQVRKYFGTE